MQRFAPLLLVCLGSASAAKLPHFLAEEGSTRTTALERDGKWWAHLGDHVYHSPPQSSGLSTRASDYYYAFGSAGALSQELQSRRVGGQGRLHIFHLPEGPAMLQVDAGRGTRRSAISKLQQVKEHMKVSHTFPPYQKSSKYQNPLSPRAQEIEKQAVSRITADGLMSELKEITSFGTRSFRNQKASSDVQSFLQRKFEEMGFTVCLHSFSYGGPNTNIVAYVPGSSNSGEMVVLGAHYDDIPEFGHAPGAEDNGSGLAALLGIMRAFHEAGLKTKHGVAFVAFAGEEPGLLGSEAYASSLLSTKSMMEKCLPSVPGNASASSFLGFSSRRSKDSFKAIVMDEVGWQSPALKTPTVNLEAYDWTGEVMEQLAHASADHNGDSLTVVHSNNPFGSDHMSFLNRRIPAVLTINGDDEAYPFYHTSGDEISQVTGSLVAKVAKMDMGGLLRLAGLEAA